MRCTESSDCLAGWSAAIAALIYDLFPKLYGLRQVKNGELHVDMLQRLAHARALVLEPKLLILDEPTRGR